MLIENVRGFTMDFGKESAIQNYSENLRRLLSAKYDVHSALLDLSSFGVPQLRTRYFLIALQPGLCAGNPFDLLQARLPSYLRSLNIQAPVSSWSAISDLEVIHGGRRPSRDTPGFEEISYTSPRTRYQKLMRGDHEKEPTDLRLARHSDIIVNRFTEIIQLSHASGRLNTAISEDIRTKYGLKKKALRVLDPDRPSPTITSMPDDLLHYKEPRTLTVRENARLQGFPDWFSFQGKYTTGGDRRRREVPRFTQVANAVPPLVARAIGELLEEILQVAAHKKDGLASARFPQGVVQTTDLPA
jgi:DNA (cytosine-5)-methyltransferase 1